jgi:hypothetical protein
MLLANRPAFARVERGAGFGGKPRREPRRFWSPIRAISPSS